MTDLFKWRHYEAEIILTCGGCNVSDIMRILVN